MVAELSLYMLEEPEVLWDPQENKSVKELGGQVARAGNFGKIKNRDKRLAM